MSAWPFETSGSALVMWSRQGDSRLMRVVRKPWDGIEWVGLPEDEIHTDGCGVEFGDAFRWGLD
jgi:hypothetical protein